MFRYIFILVLLFGCQVLSIGQSANVTIKGQVDSSYLSETGSIYAYTYEDHISFREKEIARSMLDEKGNFNLSFTVSEPVYLFLTVDNARAEMVTEPGKSYEIRIFAKDSNAITALSAVNPVEIEFSHSDNRELNFLIADFTMRYETMLDDYRGSISRKEPAIFKKIDTLETLFKKKYAAFNIQYLNNYVYYTFASLEDNLALGNKEDLYNEHIAGKPVLLNDRSYMTFFNQFYAVTSTYFMNNPKMLDEVNNKQSFSSMMDLMKQSKLLAHDTIRETVLLKSLSEYFRYPDFKPNAVLAVLDQATQQCKAPENRRAAENLKNKLSVMVAGKPAPALTFQDMDGKAVSLSDFKGKYVYLNFWTTTCASCTQDMTLIPELKKTYGGKIVFVSVSLDKKPETVANFLKKNPKLSPEKNSPGWTYLYADNYKKVKEEFNVLIVPTYFLIDPKGNVWRSPAARPADIEPDMMEIKKRR